MFRRSFTIAALAGSAAVLASCAPDRSATAPAEVSRGSNTAVTATPAADVTTTVKVNEVESSGGTPGDWAELYNTGATAVDLSGYVFRDNDDTHTYVIPAGTTIAANGYLVLDEAQFGFGLGAADAARLFAPGGTQLVDSYSWTSHATITYGRCPNGTGDFINTSASTKGATNACGVVVPPQDTYSPWPGDQTITVGDAGGVFGGNLSGLFYQPLNGLQTGVVWGVRNGPGSLFRLTFVNGVWTPGATRTWVSGKALRYPDGAGEPDAEGVTVVGNAVYVASERNNANNTVSRNAILRYDVSVENGATLIATHEWNITADIPANGANLGLEAITQVPDVYLVGRGFFDETKGHAYNPAEYPNHGDRLFFVGVEASGMIYAYALDHVTGGFSRIASFTSGYPAIMDLSFDAELGQFWAVCDDGCQGRTSVLRIDTQAGSATLGRFIVAQRFERPTGMPNLNNEGFTFAPLSECVGGKRPALWADDGETGGFSIRRGTVTCTPF